MTAKPLIIRDWEKNKRERVRLALDTYQGHRLIDLRITMQLGGSDVWAPTRKGVSLKVELLPDLIAALSEALDASNAEAT